MKYIKYKNSSNGGDYIKQEEIEKGNISSLKMLADIMETSDICMTWIEGLGEPMSYNEVRIWKTIAKFIKEKVLNENYTFNI